MLCKSTTVWQGYFSQCLLCKSTSLVRLPFTVLAMQINHRLVRIPFTLAMRTNHCLVRLPFTTLAMRINQFGKATFHNACNANQPLFGKVTFHNACNANQPLFGKATFHNACNANQPPFSNAMQLISWKESLPVQCSQSLCSQSLLRKKSTTNQALVSFQPKFRISYASLPQCN